MKTPVIKRGCLAAMLCLIAFGCLPTIPVVPIPDPINPPNPVIPITSGFRVLIIEEGAERRNLLPEQAAILTSSTLRDFCKANGAELHCWDKDVDATRKPAEWQSMLKRPRQSLPWMIVEGKKVFEGPLPKTDEEVQSIIASHKP